MSRRSKISYLQLARWLLYYTVTRAGDMIDFLKRIVGLKKSNNGALSKIEKLPKHQRNFILVDEVKSGMENLALFNCGYIKNKDVAGYQMMTLPLKKIPRV